MILPDVKLLVFAAHHDAPHHDVTVDWLRGAVSDDAVALCDLVIAGAIRVLTNPRVFQIPAPMREALAFIDALRAEQTVRMVHATAATWRTFAELAARDSQIRANLVPDAYLAALAISHGCRLASVDRGFGRFPGLVHFDPTR